MIYLVFFFQLIHLKLGLGKYRTFYCGEVKSSISYIVILRNAPNQGNISNVLILRTMKLLIVMRNISQYKPEKFGSEMFRKGPKYTSTYLTQQSAVPN